MPEVDLDGMPVFKVADVLRDCGIPFVFSTGYDPATAPARILPAGIGDPQAVPARGSEA
jgi:hypothetical protein